jgi:hypothetical protein
MPGGKFIGGRARIVRYPFRPPAGDISQIAHDTVRRDDVRPRRHEA